MRRLAPSVVLLLALSVGAPPAAAGDEAPAAIREWEVPWEDTRPRDPYAESAESVWFVGQVGHYLARLDVPSGRFEKVPLPDRPGPHNLVVDERSVVWFAGNLKGYVGRYDPGAPAGERMERIPMPREAAGDPHTLAFAPDGRIWLTLQAGNFVGRLDPESREVVLARVPTTAARPYGIVVAPDGTPWVALFGTSKLASLDPETLAVTEHPLPRAEARPRRIGLTSDGRVWYGDYAQGRLGAFDPSSGTFEEWRLPSGEDARPYALAVDARDRVWVVETGPQPNRLVGFDPAREAFLGPVPIPSGGGTVRNAHFHAPSRSLWFGTDAGTVGRARLE